MKIDQDLLDLIENEQNKTVHVVLTCHASHPASDAELASHKFKADKKQTLGDLLLIHGDIQLHNVKLLAAVPGIESISSAPEAKIS